MSAGFLAMLAVHFVSSFLKVNNNNNSNDNNERKEICRSPEPFNESLLLKKLRDFYLMRNNNITPSTSNDYWTTAYATCSASQERHHFLCLNTTTTIAAAAAENVFFLGPCCPVRRTNAERKLRRKMKKNTQHPKKEVDIIQPKWRYTRNHLFQLIPFPRHVWSFSLYTHIRDKTTKNPINRVAGHIYTLSIKGHGTNKPLPKLFSSFFFFFSNIVGWKKKKKKKRILLLL